MEKSSFFNAVLTGEEYDREYLAEDYARYFASFIGNGVFPNPATGLQLLAIDNNMNIRIKQGKAWINGYFYENTDDYILKLDVADGVLNRIDRVILRLDFLKREIKVYIKKGDYASSAIPKPLQRDADAYEIALADIAVNRGAINISQANITDLRLNKELCGVVHGTVDQVDPTAIFNQFQSWYSQTKDNYDKDIAKWTTDKKQSFDKWYLDNTTVFMQQFNKWYGDNTSKWTTDFNTWFATVKGLLDGDIGAKLATKVTDLESKIGILGGAGTLKEKANKEDLVALVKTVDTHSSENALDMLSHKAKIATTTTVGHTQLQTTIDNSETKSATPKAVKVAFDLATNGGMDMLYEFTTTADVSILEIILDGTYKEIVIELSNLKSIGMSDVNFQMMLNNLNNIYRQGTRYYGSAGSSSTALAANISLLGYGSFSSSKKLNGLIVIKKTLSGTVYSVNSVLQTDQISILECSAQASLGAGLTSIKLFGEVNATNKIATGLIITVKGRK